MAKNSDNLFTDGFRGTVGGNMTFRRKRSGKVIVSKRRRASTVPATAEQEVIKERFRMAIIYGKTANANPVTRAMYAAVANLDQSAYNMAVRDAAKPPVVHSIDASAYAGQVGNTILVRATDDFKVTAVKVSIHTQAGDLVEENNAVLQENGLDWLYTATAVHADLPGSIITATAVDLPGNETSLEIQL